jgi:hypothetical protein
MAAKRWRSDMPASSGDGAGDGEGWGRATWSRGVAADEDDLEEGDGGSAAPMNERVADLEAAMGRLSGLVGVLRRQQSETAILVTEMAGHIERIQTWTAWLQRVYDWMCNAARRFPWQ